MSQSRVTAEAMQWLIRIETSRSVEQLWPSFETWLLGDRKNWTAFMQARQQWSRWDHLAALLSQDRRAISERLATLEKRRTAARAQREVLWFALGMSLLALVLF